MSEILAIVSPSYLFSIIIFLVIGYFMLTEPLFLSWTYLQSKRLEILFLKYKLMIPLWVRLKISQYQMKRYYKKNGK